MTCEASQITQLGGDQRSDDRANAGIVLIGCSMGEKPLDVKMELGELVFEELQLRHHGTG